MHEVASLLESHLLNAREHSRMAPADQRPAMLSLQNIAFSSGCIGLDRMRGEEQAKKRNAKTTPPAANTASSNTETAPAASRVPRPRNRAAAAVSTAAAATPLLATEPDSQAPHWNTAAAAPTSPRPPPSRPNDAAQQGGRPQITHLDSRNRRPSSAPPPNPSPPADRRWYILWRQIQQAGAEDPNTPRGEIAKMIWPTDDCSRYNLPLQESGFPRPTAVQLDAAGKPRIRPDGSEARVYTGVKKACRFCSVWAAKHRINVADPTGGHNPKTCQDAARAIAQLAGGRDFLAEARGYRN